MIDDDEIAILERLELLLFMMRNAPFDVAVEIAKQMDDFIDSLVGVAPSR